MGKLLGPAVLAALLLLADGAAADQITGTINGIDLIANTFRVGDKLFTASPSNTVGPALDELEVGDQVTVTFTQGKRDQGGKPINAMIIKRAE